MKKTRGIARRGRGKGKKREQEMVFSSDDENAFSPPKEQHFTRDPKHAVQDHDAALKHAIPTELITYKYRGKKGSSSHHATRIDEEMDDLQDIHDALCCVTEAEKVADELASESQRQINKDSTSTDGLSMIRCSKRSRDMQLSVPMDLSVKQKRGPSCSATFNLSEIAMDDDEDGVESSFGPASVNVRGYRVRPEIAPILHQILEEQGDISKDCKLQKVLQSCLLEKVCHVHEKLRNSSFKEIQRNELFEMEETISALENQGFNLQWLSNKLAEILDGKLFLNVLAKKKKELKKAKDQLETLRKAMAPIEQRGSELEEELKKMKRKSAIQKLRNLYCNPLI